MFAKILVVVVVLTMAYAGTVPMDIPVETRGEVFDVKIGSELPSDLPTFPRGERFDVKIGSELPIELPMDSRGEGFDVKIGSELPIDLPMGSRGEGFDKKIETGLPVGLPVGLPIGKEFPIGRAFYYSPIPTGGLSEQMYYGYGRMGIPAVAPAVPQAAYMPYFGYPDSRYQYY